MRIAPTRAPMRRLRPLASPVPTTHREDRARASSSSSSSLGAVLKEERQAPSAPEDRIPEGGGESTEDVSKSAPALASATLGLEASAR